MTKTSSSVFWIFEFRSFEFVWSLDIGNWLFIAFSSQKLLIEIFVKFCYT